MKKINNEIYKGFGDSWYHSKNCIALLRNESKTRNAWVIKKLQEQYENTECKILDVGCGGGFLANELSKNNFTVTGIDLYEESLVVARAYDTTKKVNYMQANAYSLPFENESFDVICLMDFIEHIEDVDSLLKECSRVVKKNGRIYFHTFNKNFISWFVAIKCVEWFIKGTPKNLHVYNLFIKPHILFKKFAKFGFQKKELVGLKPILTLKALFHFLTKREVHEKFSFKITKSTFIGYLGYVAKKNY